jgi:hypothetical protein
VSGRWREVTPARTKELAALHPQQHHPQQHTLHINFHSSHTQHTHTPHTPLALHRHHARKRSWSAQRGCPEAQCAQPTHGREAHRAGVGLAGRAGRRAQTETARDSKAISNVRGAQPALAAHTPQEIKELQADTCQDFIADALEVSCWRAAAGPALPTAATVVRRSGAPCYCWRVSWRADP